MADQSRSSRDIVLTTRLDAVNPSVLLIAVPTRCRLKEIFVASIAASTELITPSSAAGVIGTATVGGTARVADWLRAEDLASYDDAANILEAGDRLQIGMAGITTDWYFTLVLGRL